MPNAPRTPSRNMRIHEAVWNASLARAQREGRTLTAVVVEFLEGYGGVKTPPPASRRLDAIVMCIPCKGTGKRGRGQCRTCKGSGGVTRRVAKELGWRVLRPA
jgi:DnaJ-class molecular chaperone